MTDAAAVRRIAARSLDVPTSAVTITATERGWDAHVGRGRLEMVRGYESAWWDEPGRQGVVVFLVGGVLGEGEDHG